MRNSVFRQRAQRKVINTVVHSSTSKNTEGLVIAEDDGVEVREDDWFCFICQETVKTEMARNWFTSGREVHSCCHACEARRRAAYSKHTAHTRTRRSQGCRQHTPELTYPLILCLGSHRMTTRTPIRTGPQWLSGQPARLSPRQTGLNSQSGHPRVFKCGIVTDNAAGRRVFSVISHCPIIPVPLHTYLSQPHRLSRPRCLEPPKSLHSSPILRAPPASFSRIMESSGCAGESDLKAYQQRSLGEVFDGSNAVGDPSEEVDGIVDVTLEEVDGDAAAGVPSEQTDSTVPTSGIDGSATLAPLLPKPRSVGLSATPLRRVSVGANGWPDTRNPLENSVLASGRVSPAGNFSGRRGGLLSPSRQKRWKGGLLQRRERAPQSQARGERAGDQIPVEGGEFAIRRGMLNVGGTECKCTWSVLELESRERQRGVVPAVPGHCDSLADDKHCHYIHTQLAQVIDVIKSGFLAADFSCAGNNLQFIILRVFRPVLIRPPIFIASAASSLSSGITSAVSGQHYRSARASETGDRRENPMTRSIVRHDCHERIVLDDTAGRRVFSETFKVPCPCIQAMHHSNLISPLSALKISLFFDEYSDMHPMNIIQRGMERAMLGFTRRDRQRDDYIRPVTKVRDILERVKTLNWQWAGHIARRSDDRWTTELPSAFSVVGYLKVDPPLTMRSLYRGSRLEGIPQRTQCHCVMELKSSTSRESDGRISVEVPPRRYCSRLILLIFTIVTAYVLSGDRCGRGGVLRSGGEMRWRPLQTPVAAVVMTPPLQTSTADKDARTTFRNSEPASAATPRPRRH
ncbi:hypothetical protein PR048_009039 [Dryococelus australis]|uniref:Uncharacterized protein n=1 Tax=Dryococelus australis TaxID=614101 RepID=A0ABQ9HZV1_9NEOP|nr:hypothetical protein PR048_009039 [Dryococelus australis]